MQGKGGLFFQNIEEQIAAAYGVPENRCQAAPATSQEKTRINRASRAILERVPSPLAIMDSFAAPSARMILANTLLKKNDRRAQGDNAQIAAGCGKG